MRSQIKTVNISRISQSQTTIPVTNYDKSQSQIAKVKYPVKPISAAQNLQQKIQSFKNTKVQNDLRNSLSILNSYRQVRGDGNCFFRALAFTYLSNIKSVKVDKCFCFLKQICLTCCYQKSIPKDYQKFYDGKFLQFVLTSNWEKCYQKELKQNDNLHMKALVKLFNIHHFLDFIVVLYFRSVCLKALQKFKPQVKDFLDGSEQVNIRQYSQQSQGIILDLCSRMLKIQTHVYEVRKDKVQKYEWKNINSTPLTTIHLLFYQNHYDIVQKNDFISAQISVLQINQEDYFQQVNEKLTRGNCIQCDVVAQIYEENGLCVKCYQASINNLHNYQKQKFVKGKCNQCFQIKKQVSETYGLCKDCIQIQNYYQKKKQDQPKYIRGKCSQCGFTEQIQPEFKLCKTCKNYQKRYTQRVYEGNSPFKSKNTQIKSPKRRIRGQCNGCKYFQDIDEDTKLCKDCDKKKQSKIKTTNIRQSANKQQSKIKHEIKKTGYCTICKQLKYISEESRICQQCINKKSTIKAKSNILGDDIQNKLGYKSQIYSLSKEEQISCVRCYKKFPKKSSLGITNNRCPYCKQIVRDNTSTFDDMKCKKCGNLCTKRQNGLCKNCISKKDEKYCRKCGKQSERLSSYDLCLRCAY